MSQFSAHPDGPEIDISHAPSQFRGSLLNNKVRLIIRRAYGFHSAEAALALVMLSCGPVDLELPHERAA